MSWTPATFRARWPEFNATSDSDVTNALADAALRIDPALFGLNADPAVGLLAAHLLTIAPMGMQNRLESDKADTTYNRELQRLVRNAAGGPWIAGQTP